MSSGAKPQTLYHVSEACTNRTCRTINTNKDIIKYSFIITSSYRFLSCRCRHGFHHMVLGLFHYSKSPHMRLCLKYFHYLNRTRGSWTTSLIWEIFNSNLTDLSKIINKMQVIKIVFNPIPLENLGSLSFEQIWIPINSGCFVPSLVEIGFVVLGEDKNMKSLFQRIRRTMDEYRSENLTWALGSDKPTTNINNNKGPEGPYCSPEYSVQINKHILATLWLHPNID